MGKGAANSSASIQMPAIMNFDMNFVGRALSGVEKMLEGNHNLMSPTHHEVIRLWAHLNGLIMARWRSMAIAVSVKTETFTLSA